MQQITHYRVNRHHYILLDTEQQFSAKTIFKNTNPSSQLLTSSLRTTAKLHLPAELSYYLPPLFDQIHAKGTNYVDTECHRIQAGGRATRIPSEIGKPQTDYWMFYQVYLGLQSKRLSTMIQASHLPAQASV
ncbi:hypothetical protein [Pelagibaculum spongiae]|uniref:Uncharacterized protein n=1 Tax=Pelagibaculum spongiae TaxID=2080658 RepID=A0A2V1GZL2_9GAMM|nr:hypothetical protein [Pelagibaculum spongiae]PVZ68822.1 hypothetical protein DC094_11240 [Pelagibaculum spongiae]